MSTIEEDQEEIEAALAMVNGIRTYRDPSAATRQGDCFVSILRVGRDENRFPIATWRIRIVAGQDVATAAAYTAWLLPEVALALGEVLTWNDIQPGRLQDSNVMVVEIDGTREISSLEG